MLFRIVEETIKWILNTFVIPKDNNPPTICSEFVEEEPNIIDGVCCMTLKQSRELKDKMKNDIKIAREAINKAEALVNGRIGDPRNCFLFNSSVQSDFLHIRNSDKMDMNRVNQYRRECNIEEEFDAIIGEEEIK